MPPERTRERLPCHSCTLAYYRQCVGQRCQWALVQQLRGFLLGWYFPGAVERGGERSILHFLRFFLHGRLAENEDGERKDAGMVVCARAGGLLASFLWTRLYAASAVVLQALDGPRRAAEIAALQPAMHRAQRLQRVLCRQMTQARQGSEMQRRNLMRTLACDLSLFRRCGYLWT